MNLMSLFNVKYLIQNLKKSKAIIVLFMLIVPMFTSILLLSVDDNYALSFPEVSIVNIICMYILPIILSMALFNYVYKKNSVDFIGSMPLSRKTIFLTNTIGGIAIITLMQLLTMISTLLLSKILSNIIIFSSMIWDIFIFYTISYIFVFVVSNLAMSFSGNKIAQLVAICLILFTIPFLIMSGNVFGDRYSYVNVEESLNNSLNEDSDKIILEGSFNFTAPSYIFDMVINGEEIYVYNTQVVWKMTFLSILYIIIGLITFDKKKLEMAGESYESINAHLVIKMLTFIPFMFVYCSLSNSDKINVFLFFAAILAVYYFVFDLITNKKIKLKISIPAFIISGIIVFAVFEGIIPKFGRNNIDIVNVDEIETVEIKSVNGGYRSECDFGLLIEDKKLIDLIISDSIDVVHNSEYYGISTEVYPIDTADVELNYNENSMQKVMYRSSTSKIVLNLKNGKTYEYTRYLNADIYKTIIETLGEKKIEKSFGKAIPLIEGINLTKQQQDELLDLINNELTNLSYKELFKLYNTERTEYTINLYEYKNHKLIVNNFSYKGFDDAYKKFIKICNKHTVENFEYIYRFNLEDETYFKDLVKERNKELCTGEFIELKYPDGKYHVNVDLIYNLFKYNNEIIEFIKQDINNEVNINEKYICISS
ncbi:MAG: ABC transporter permease, partial [Clostridia bacterium]|nr:ABC transporter permease [Clostridia bacterium]